MPLDGAKCSQRRDEHRRDRCREIVKRLEAVRQGTQGSVGRGIEAVHAALEKLKSRLGEVEQAVGKAQAQVNDATAKMAEAYKGLTVQIEASLAQQVLAVKNRTTRKRRRSTYSAVRSGQDYQNLDAVTHRRADAAGDPARSGYDRYAQSDRT